MSRSATLVRAAISALPLAMCAAGLFPATPGAVADPAPQTALMTVHVTGTYAGRSPGIGDMSTQTSSFTDFAGPDVPDCPEADDLTGGAGGGASAETWSGSGTVDLTLTAEMESDDGGAGWGVPAGGQLTISEDFTSDEEADCYYSETGDPGSWQQVGAHPAQSEFTIDYTHTCGDDCDSLLYCTTAADSDCGFTDFTGLQLDYELPSSAYTSTSTRAASVYTESQDFDVDGAPGDGSTFVGSYGPGPSDQFSTWLPWSFPTAAGFAIDPSLGGTTSQNTVHLDATLGATTTTCTNGPTADSATFTAVVGQKLSGRLTATPGAAPITSWNVVKQSFATRTHKFVWGGDGTFSLTPPSLGKPVFTYTVTDANGCTSPPATVRINEETSCQATRPRISDQTFEVLTGRTSTLALAKPTASRAIKTWKLLSQSFTTKSAAFKWNAKNGHFSLKSPKNGTRTLKYKVIDSAGCASAPATARIKSGLIVAKLKITYPGGLPPLAATFSAAGSKAASGKPLTYRFALGPTTVTSRSTSVSYLYRTPVRRVVKVTVSDGAHSATAAATYVPPTGEGSFQSLDATTVVSVEQDGNRTIYYYSDGSSEVLVPGKVHILGPNLDCEAYADTPYKDNGGGGWDVAAHAGGSCQGSAKSATLHTWLFYATSNTDTTGWLPDGYKGVTKTLKVPPNPNHPDVDVKIESEGCLSSSANSILKHARYWFVVVLINYTRIDGTHHTLQASSFAGHTPKLRGC